MTKYSEIDIQTAKTLLKEGCKWIARDGSGRLFAYIDKPKKWDELWWSCGRTGYVCEAFGPIFQNVKFEDSEPTSLDSIVHPQILDDAEKRYLKGVIRPFRDKVLGITKFLDTKTGEEYIAIDTGEEMGALLPDFEANTMYEGMVLRKEYTLEELGL